MARRQTGGSSEGPWRAAETGRRPCLQTGFFLARVRPGQALARLLLALPFLAKARPARLIASMAHEEAWNWGRGRVGDHVIRFAIGGEKSAGKQENTVFQKSGVETITVEFAAAFRRKISELRTQFRRSSPSASQLTSRTRGRSIIEKGGIDEVILLDRERVRDRRRCRDRNRMLAQAAMKPEPAFLIIGFRQDACERKLGLTRCFYHYSNIHGNGCKML